MSFNLILLKKLEKNLIYLLAYFKNIFSCCQITKRSSFYCIINNFEMNVFFFFSDAECLNQQEAQQTKKVKHKNHNKCYTVEIGEEKLNTKKYIIFVKINLFL